MLLAFLIFLPLVLLNVVLSVYSERKISAFIQDRIGPMETGKFGLLQLIADLLKLLQKEDIIPAAADKLLFRLAPIILFVAIFSGLAVIPLSPDVIGSGAMVGVFYLLAIISLDVIGILLAGWSSNNKYSLYGAIRSVAQIVSYEVPLGLAVLCVVIVSQTLNLQEISYQQGLLQSSSSPAYLFGITSLGIEVSNWGGIFAWNILRMPLMPIVFVIFFISGLAESNRAPFDLPEAESELIGGYHTEYSGFRWALIMLTEYASMLLMSFLGATLFLGAWNTPLPNLGGLALADWTSGAAGTWAGNLWGAFWLVSKVYSLMFLMMMARWTYPRLRVDQLMSFGWKYLTPAALLLVFACSLWRLLH